MTTKDRSIVLLFDLGGVLIENVGFQRFGALLSRPMALNEMKLNWLRSPAVRRFESGVTSAREFAREVVDEWELKLSPSSFLSQFKSWPREASEEAVVLVRELREHYRVACLSNSNELHWDRFSPLVQEFDIAISSHLSGRLKPDADAFLGALAQCAAPPQNVFFFDDSLPNVEGARAVGVESFHVEGLDQLREILQLIHSRHGIGR